MEQGSTGNIHQIAVTIPIDDGQLEGDLYWPGGADEVVLFAHGSGSSRQSPRNRYVAQVLNDAGLATLLMDLLTPDEEQIDMQTRHLRFDIGLLADRLVRAIDWLEQNSNSGQLKIGCFGASTGAAAALVAGAERAYEVQAVVSRGGRPDLAGESLDQVCVPTLLIVGGLDKAVIDMNREAMTRLSGETKLEIVPGATHLFEEPGKLEEVARLASQWFTRTLRESGAPPTARENSDGSHPGYS